MIDFADDSPISDDTPTNCNRRPGVDDRLNGYDGRITTSTSVRRAQALRAKLLTSITESNIEEAVGALTTLAVGGNLTAIKLLFEYAAGRPAQAREVAGPDEGPRDLSIEKLQASILGALSPHPQAKLDLAAALDELARDRSIRTPGESLRRQPPHE